MYNKLRIGLVINPIAGIGGSVALKGSDGKEVQAQAVRRGGVSQVHHRVATAFSACQRLAEIHIVTCEGVMGSVALEGVAVHREVIDYQPATPTSREDTQQVARQLVAANVDLLIFAGGDGTARDVQEVVGEQLCLGIPGGVKMHSGVFTISPSHAGRLLDALLSGGLVSSSHADVRDIDERKLAKGQLSSRFFGEMRVPKLGGYLQHTKIGGRENAALAVEEIVVDVCEQIESEGGAYLLGPGSTVKAIKDRLNMNSTLLGFDYYCDGVNLLDLTESQIAELVDGKHWRLIVSYTRGQGFLFGRGNQQCSARLLAQLHKDNLLIVSTREKLATLSGRPLLVDTGDVELDDQLAGLHELITGYQDRLLYRVGHGGSI